jgi:putative oxidoreductase
MTWTRLLFRSPPWGHDAALALLRAAFGLTLAFAHGVGKAADLGKFTASVASRGFPLPTVLAPAAALSELVGGILLAVGLMTRPAAAFVSITMLTAALRVHANDPFARKELGLAYAAVAIALLIAGAGRFSLDARLFGKR